MIKVNVEINSQLWKKKITNPKEYFKTKLKKINSINKFFNKKNITFTILLTNSNHMKKLNKKFRKINKPTDVLSFSFFSSQYLKNLKEKKIYLGDIAASYEIIKSREKKSDFIKEFDKVWIHGLLHLVGYNHTKDREYFKMLKVERKFLNSIYN